MTQLFLTRGGFVARGHLGLSGGIWGYKDGEEGHHHHLMVSQGCWAISHFRTDHTVGNHPVQDVKNCQVLLSRAPGDLRHGASVVRHLPGCAWPQHPRRARQEPSYALLPHFEYYFVLNDSVLVGRILVPSTAEPCRLVPLL